MKEFMDRLCNNKKLSTLFIIGSFVFNLFLFSIIYLMNLKLSTPTNVFECLLTNKNGIQITVLCVILTLLYVGSWVFSLLTIYHHFKKDKMNYLQPSILNVSIEFCLIVLAVSLKIFNGFAVFLIILNFIASILQLIFIFYYKKNTHDDNELDFAEEKTSIAAIWKKILFGINVASILGIILMFFIPLFTFLPNTEYAQTFIIISGLAGSDIPRFCAFVALFIVTLFTIIYFINSLAYYNHDKIFLKKTNNLVYLFFGISLVFFLTGNIVVFYDQINGNEASTISFIPLILSIIVVIFFSIIKGKFSLIEFKDEHKRKVFRFEPLIYLAILTLITIASLFFEVIVIKLEFYSSIKEISFTGLKLLQDSPNLSASYQLMAFLIFAIVLTSVLLLITSLAAYFSKDDDCYKIIRLSIYINVFFAFVLGMSSIFYSIAQKMNEENILAILEEYNIYISDSYTYTITGQTIYLFIASFIVFLVAIIRHQLSITATSVNIGEASIDIPKSQKTNNTFEEPSVNANEPLLNQALINFDACPSFSELDANIPNYNSFLITRKQYQFENPTLPSLVRFIVDYARESRLHLSYTEETIATFVAGLGASRLTILQGMSGTGKTSLPKIFAEAIIGNCEIVEVESSWRDKNELLGYYNEFTKCYTPKKFTEYLYKAKLNPEVPTFILLDEMNLSRIEYYFSDFLSLMEHEEDKREIKLLNVGLYNTIDNVKYRYAALENGHTIKVPTNVWFIGTANRDESTFEISDKVYDRAQTMNFNKRAPKVRSFTAPFSQRYLSYNQLQKLLKDAITNGDFEAEENEIVKAVEKLLAPYNISFGNRILKQMEEFVKIYCACFNNDRAILNDAVEKILLSKVVSKLEFKNIENKDKLANEFKKLNLNACYEFISKLNED